MKHMVSFLVKFTINIFDHIKYLLAVLIAIMEDIKLVTIGMLFMIVANQISGVIKAIKGKAEYKFSWKIFNTFYLKIILYNICIISAHTLEHTILESDDYLFTKIVASVMGFQELFSSIENTGIIFNKDFLGQFKRLTHKKIKSILK